MIPNRKKGAARAKNNSRYSVKRRKRRMTIIVILIAVFVLLCIAGTWAYYRFRSFDAYAVKANLDLTNSDERTTYVACKKGYIKCAGDGVTYFDKKGVLWAETFEMMQPLTDTNGSFLAVADLKSADIYLYDETGLAGRISASHPILDLEVSAQGVVAAAMNEGQSNYIEVFDKEGNELISAKSVFSSSGYLMDIALSEDGSSLAAAYVYVSEGNLESKVVFYDFSGNGEITGGFNQYQNTIVTNVEFLNADTVCAIGDNALTIYKVSGAPTILYEDLELSYEIQSVFFDAGRLGLIVDDQSSENTYTIKVFNAKGKEIVTCGFDFPYTKAAFAGKNVLLYSADNCEIYSFTGTRRFAYTFDERINYMLSCGNGRDFIYATANNTEFIRIK